MSKTATFPASEAEVGKEYTSPKGSTVKVTGHNGDKTVILVKTPGYGYNSSRPIEVPGSYELTGSAPTNGNGKKEAKVKAKADHLVAKAERHAAKAAAKEAKKQAKGPIIVPPRPKATKEGRKRLPKVEGKLPTVVIGGIKFRTHYRARLSEQRAYLCQKAEKEICNCRCGHMFHGKSHKSWFEAEAILFEKYNGPVPAAEIAKLAEKLSGTKLQK